MAAVPPPLLEDVARRFRLLGDPTRLRLLNALQQRGEVSVGELADSAGTGLANASKHLAALEQAGIVSRRRVGTSVRYRIADPTIAALCDLVCAGVRERVAALARRVA